MSGTAQIYERLSDVGHLSPDILAIPRRGLRQFEKKRTSCYYNEAIYNAAVAQW